MLNYYINYIFGVDFEYVFVSILNPIADSAAPIVNKNNPVIIPFISSNFIDEEINIKLIPNNNNSNDTNTNILLFLLYIILIILNTISTFPIFVILALFTLLSSVVKWLKRITVNDLILVQI